MLSSRRLWTASVKLIVRNLSVNTRPSFFEHQPPIDHEALRQASTQQRILTNISLRGLDEDYPQLFESSLTTDQLYERLVEVAPQLPNWIDPKWLEGSVSSADMHVLEYVNERPQFTFKPARAEQILFNGELAEFSDLRTGKLGIAGGKRSYAFLDKCALLARALARWTMDTLVREYHFTPVVPPTLIRPELIRACGFEPFGARTQVYKLEDELSKTAVAGTAEMPLAALHLGEHFGSPEELPKRYCALSRCYRAEAKSPGEMSGLYRVHYFDKVEMFALVDAQPGSSERMLHDFVNIQRRLFNALGLHYRVVDMPPVELGPPAYRKYDIEAYMAGRDFWGEISSTSNCTDYQAKRLNITYDQVILEHDQMVGVERCHVHTVNGTACAVPRMIIALVEQFQTQDGHTLPLPKVLRPYLQFDSLH